MLLSAPYAPVTGFHAFDQMKPAPNARTAGSDFHASVATSRSSSSRTDSAHSTAADRKTRSAAGDEDAPLAQGHTAFPAERTSPFQVASTRSITPAGSGT